ncbi:nuclear transport factor 2 family protein [Sphingomonas sp.]|uniref:nuclear transport factor 2 family protein n=1 Tax=Sphingomonas sp. TaxID=28214 RepID=UPI003B00F373
MTEEQAAQLQMLVDREAIRDVVARYCFGTDRCDDAVLWSVYWPEATDNHGVFSGPVHEYIPFARKIADGTDSMQHFVGSMLIRVTGDTARTESYFFAYIRYRAETGPEDKLVAGRYLDEMEKRDGEWRILRRKVDFDWARELEGSADWSQGATAMLGAMAGRAPGDHASRMFANDALARPAFES